MARRSQMSMEERRARIGLIIARHAQGTQIADLAHDYRLTANYVRSLLKEHGVDTSDRVKQGDRSDAMWGMPEDDRRNAIIARQKQGARQTLKSQFGIKRFAQNSQKQRENTCAV